MIKRLLPLLLLFAVASHTACGQTFNKTKLDSLLNALEQNNKGMGTLVLSKNGQIIYQKSTGIQSSPGTPATEKTKYRIGSITKIFTAVIIFQLFEEGKLSLDTKLSAYYPQIPNADKITIGMMLNHRTGLHNFTDSTYLTYYTKPKTHQQLLDIFASQTPDFEPHTKASYSNTNYVLLGYIAEKITGTNYPELIKKRITAKISLKDTYYGGKIIPRNHEASSFKHTDNNWQEEAETDMSIPGGAGAIVSTPAALAKFIEALFAGKLISNKSLEIMKTIKDGYGSGMFRYNFDNKIGYGHNGGIDEFKSTLSYFPDEKLTLAYCANGMNYNLNSVVLGALSSYFGKPYTIPSFKTIDITPEELDKYVGNYASDQMPLKISITKKNTTLMAQSTGQSAFSLDAVEKDKFTFEPAGIVMEFAPAKNEMILKQAGRTYLYVKTN